MSRAAVVLLALFAVDLFVFVGVAQLGRYGWADWGSPHVMVERQVRQQVPMRAFMPFRPGERLRLPGGPAFSPPTVAAEASGPAAQGGIAGPSVTVDRTVLEQVVLRPFGLQVPGPWGALTHVAGLVAALGLSMVAFLLFPGHMARWAAPLHGGLGAWLRAVLLGLVGYLALGALAFLSGVTIAGLLVVLLLGAMTLALTLGGLTSVALAIGRALADRLRLPSPDAWWTLAAGIALIVLLAALPLVGWFVFIGVLLAGFGAGLWSRFGHPSGWQGGPPDGQMGLQPPMLEDA